MPKGVYESPLRGKYERTREIRARAGVRSLKHGLIRSGAYSSWGAMKARCLNPNHADYPRYGGRGITVCERWLTFLNFYADMGDRPEGMTLERINNDGNYEPGNCRWATRSEQAVNRLQTAAVAGGRAAWPDGRAERVKAELVTDPNRSNAVISEIAGCTRARVRQIRAEMGLQPAARSRRVREPSA